MPETPDFDQLARVMLKRVNLHGKPDGFDEEVKIAAEHLRQVWNARGAQDADRIAELEAELTLFYPAGVGRAPEETLRQAEALAASLRKRLGDH